MRRETGSYIWSFHDETPSERKLSAAMRKAGIRFGQEVPVKSFTVDFLVDRWLVVEVDGESHLVKGRAERDASRQKAIEDAGFTVLRVPAGDLSSEGGLRRWVKRIREMAAAGPPYLNQGRSQNQDYLRQIEEARRALRIGEAERAKREATAFRDPKFRTKEQGARGDGSQEPQSMEEYFGAKAEDFGALLDRESDRPTDKSWAKDEDGSLTEREPSRHPRTPPRRNRR